MRKLINITGKIALVTGGTGGIGFELCRQLAEHKCKVILTSRNSKKGVKAVKILKEMDLNVDYHQLDITCKKSVSELFKYINSRYKRADIIFNNAGIYIDSCDISEVSSKKIIDSIITNSLGALSICQVFYPLMDRNNFGRILNISSGMGVISTMECDSPAYRISKTVLNTITVMYNRLNKNKNILINSVCPGPVYTNMSQNINAKPATEACSHLINLCRLPNGDHSGCFFRYGKLIDF